MEQKIYNEYVEILKEELLPAMGCTEPIAVAYAAAVAVQALGEKPESVEVNVSANIIKNVKSVVVPCTGGLRGIGAAVCAGIVAGCPEKELEILEEITGEQKVEMKKMLDTMPMTIRESDKEYIFDIQIKACAGGHSGYVEIAGFHTNVICVKKDDEIIREKAYEEQDEIHYLIDMARRLEGLPRHTSMHAAGVVISQKDVSEYVPLSRASDGSIVTQFTMTTLEELGLLKMDFLGLRTLTVIQNAVKMIEQSTGVFLDMQKIDYNDKKVLDSLGTGRTDGVFQLESAGMKNFMKELKPQSLEDVIAGISLYRPGPMDFIPQYIRGKNRPDTIRYDCPQMEPILKPTYGCIVYQEQVMQIVRDLAGYTLGRSDLVRRAMSKKKASVMAKERQNFVYGNVEEGVPGCIANGISEEIANKIYDEMTDFAKYAFNKSHAAAYAVVSYQTAYLKYYYPVEFMAALMTSVIDNPPKVAEYILNCRQMGIRLLPPDINKGESAFSVEENESTEKTGEETFKYNKSIRYGLSAIKSIGKPVIDAIVRERNQNGIYRNFRNFVERLSGKELNKRTIENFIKAYSKTEYKYI